jgi:hypothetical protein
MEEMMIEVKVYELSSENLSGLGGRMGSESSRINWYSFFYSIDAAKQHAEADYGRPIQWGSRNMPTCNGVPNFLLCSGDLGYVMYRIRLIEVIE